MKETVFIFDTNFLYDASGKYFFGNEDEVKRFSSYGKIVIPQMVFMEREYQIRSALKIQIEKIKKECGLVFNKLSESINSIDIEEVLSSLKDNISFKFDYIDINNTDILYKMRDFGVNRIPPFQEFGKSTDKGFKDCYIYFTVLEYLENNSDRNIVFVTGDSLLKKSFSDYKNINIFEDFQTYKSSIDENLTNLIEKQFKNINIEIATSWKNYKGDLVVPIYTEQPEYRLVIEGYGTVDCKIIKNVMIDFIYNEDSLSDIIDNFCNSPSYQSTHFYTSLLNEYLDILTKDEAIKILYGFYENSQINWIASDTDVCIFINKIFGYVKSSLDKEEAEKIWKIIPLPF